MLKRDVKEMVNYLIGERKSFKVTFANGKTEIVEYRGYCWVLGNKGYSDNELVEKMVRFQNNVSKFIIKLEVIEEVNEIEEDIEKSLVEEVENLTDDLFQEEDLLYCEEAIERETNNIKGDIKMKSKEYFNLLQDIIILCTSNKDYTININHKDALRLKRLLERYSSMKIEDLRDLYK